MAKKTVADVMKLVEENDVRFVDFRFTDTLGKWQHITTPISQFNEDKFSEDLASLCDVFVNDAFGTAHRAHASTTIIAQFFQDAKCFGYLLAKEIESIEKVLKNSEKPVVAILGGSKVSSKITVIENILDKVNHMIIGGGMTFTFIKALGGKIGNSICEDDKLELAIEILKQAKEKNEEKPRRKAT